MNNRWRSLDTGLVGLAGVAIIGLLIVRFLWVGSYLPPALDAFRDSDVRLPCLTRLTITQWGFYTGLCLTAALAGVGSAVRLRGMRTVGRTLLLLASFCGACALTMDVAGVWIAQRAAPVGLTSQGARLCLCTGQHTCVGDCSCACDDRGWIVEQVVRENGVVKARLKFKNDAAGAVTTFEMDGDADGKPERRCVYEQPCPQGGERIECPMRCETVP